MFDAKGSGEEPAKYQQQVDQILDKYSDDLKWQHYKLAVLALKVFPDDELKRMSAGKGKS